MKTSATICAAVMMFAFLGISSISVGDENEMIGQWLFEEGPSGTTFWDTSGKGNHGALSGDFAWSSDAPPGESWSLYSTSANFEAIVQDDDVLDITDDFTIEATLKLAAFGIGGDLEVISKHHDHGDFDGSWNMYVGRDASDHVLIQMGAYGNWTLAWSDAVFISPNSWFHIAVTYDDSENEAIFYINEDKAALYSTADGIRTVDWQINNTPEPLTFGYEPNPGEDHVGIGDDRIGSVTMYNYVVPGAATGPIPLPVDVKPASWPNRLNPKSRGDLPTAVLGSETFDVT
ncbi:hypothetical protein LCGC14_1732450, partial [marine sediment metagenome]